MNKYIASQPGTVSYKPRWMQLLQLTIITIAAMPVTILLHEMGHYVAGLVAGFENLVLHYGSVSDAKEQEFSGWRIALFEAGGPLITVIFIICCCLYVALRKPAIVVIILGIAASVRTLLISFLYFISLVRVMIRGEKFRGSPDFDEYKVAHALHISLPLLVGLELIFLLWAWWFLIRKMPVKGRRLNLLFILIGIILGIILWVFIGPLLLP